VGRLGWTRLDWAVSRGCLEFLEREAFFTGVSGLEAREGHGDGPHEFPALLGIFHGVQLVQGFGEFDYEEGDEPVAKVRALGAMVQFMGAFEHFTPLGAAVAGFGPFKITAVPPVGEVLFGDGTAAELGGEDFLDFEQGMEPGEEFFAENAVGEAMIEFFADLSR